MSILELLRAFFRLGVEGEGEPGDPPAEETPPAEEEEIDLDTETPPKEEKGPSAEEFEAAQAAARDDRARADRAEREAADLRRQRQAPQEDEITRRENQRLSDPQISDLEKWQINSNRSMRATMGTAQLTLAQAQDLNDRTAFRALETKKPVLFKKYEAEVEKRLGEVRANGGTASREAIFAYLVGRDALDDKFTRKKAATTPAAAPAIPRGRLPGARSDVSGRTTMTEHEKRAKRLENQQI